MSNSIREKQLGTFGKKLAQKYQDKTKQTKECT
jgi:hypothetical protein